MLDGSNSKVSLNQQHQKCLQC